MGSSQPKVVLVKAKADQAWRIVISDLDSFSNTIGDEVLTAFCRCFVNCDRLTSLARLADINSRDRDQPPVSENRNLQAIFWYSVGTLRELAHAIRDLRSALAKRGLLEAQSEHWKALRELEARWDREPFFRKKRDAISFHVDSRAIHEGLTQLKDEEEVVLSEGFGAIAGNVTMRLGIEALLNGHGITLSDFERLASTTAEDQGVSLTVSAVFVSVLNRCAVPYETVER